MQFLNLIKLQNVMESGEIKLLFLTEPKPKVVISFYVVLKSAYWSIILYIDYGLFFDDFSSTSLYINKYSMFIIYVLFKCRS